MKRGFALALLFAACHRKPAPPPAAPAVTVEPQSIAVATMQHIADGPRLSGTLQPQQSATILAEVGGTVTAVNAAEGQVVGPGTLLATITDDSAAQAARSAQTAVQSAQTAVAVANRDLDRSQTLAKAGAVPRRDVDVARAQLANAQSQLAQAQAQLTQAQERVGNQRVTAGRSGTVSEKQVSAGDIVTPGAPLFTIVDLSSLQLEANVTTEALGMIHAGSGVDVEVRGYPNQTFHGVVTRIAPTVDPSTGQVRVFVVIANAGRRLVGGLFAEGRVTTVARMGVVIPLAALDESATQPMVTRVRNGVAERVPVRIGVRNEATGVVEITSGINAGDRILTGPARTIAAGTKVTAGR
jgi:RND family efflux transporter MFP subunit